MTAYFIVFLAHSKRTHYTRVFQAEQRGKNAFYRWMPNVEVVDEACSLIAIPIAIHIETNELPPEDSNGSGIPVTGDKPIFMAI
jgi:hypothetical protein